MDTVIKNMAINEIHIFCNAGVIPLHSPDCYEYVLCGCKSHADAALGANVFIQTLTDTTACIIYNVLLTGQASAYAGPFEERRKTDSFTAPIPHILFHYSTNFP